MTSVPPAHDPQSKRSVPGPTNVGACCCEQPSSDAQLARKRGTLPA
jgi:hypothetical protein